MDANVVRCVAQMFPDYMVQFNQLLYGVSHIFTHEAACDWARVFSEKEAFTESGKSEVARVHFTIRQIQDFNTMPGRLTFANAGSSLQAELRATALSRRAAILSYPQGLPMIFEVAGTVPALACMASGCSDHPLLLVAKAEPSSLETRVSAPPHNCVSGLCSS